jgi:neutral ceramidase
MFTAGSAAIDITPPVGTHLAGQFQDRIAESIHDPLYARALVLDDGTTGLAIVACDLLALKRPTVVQARELAAAQTGIPADHIMITASHTHTGPRTTDIFPCPADAEYLALLPRQLAGAVALAARSRQPARLAVGSGREATSTHNRRYLRRDGTAQMHPPKGDPSFVGPEGPADPEVGVIFANDDNGRLLGAMVNYTSHPIVVGHERAVSADYPGYLGRALQAVKGHQAEVLFVNGALANVCPIDVADLGHREYGYAWAERVGNVVAAEALRVMETTDPLETVVLRVARRTVDLAIREITAAQLAEARVRLEQHDGMPPVELAYAREALLLAEERRRAAFVPAEVQVLAIGDAALVGIPGELFVEFGLEIKERSPFAHTYVAGLANGCVGYIPTRRAFLGGGYETRLARSSKLTPEAGERLTAVALELLHELRESE